MRIDLKRGLDIHLGKSPEPFVSRHVNTTRTALVLEDYQDIHPISTVKIGERVALGQRLFADREHPNISHTSNCAGIVRSINYGKNRCIKRLVIDRDGASAVSFPEHSIAAADQLSGTAVREILLSSGAWTALRSRPFDRIATPDIQPRAIFVTAIDTNPLAPDPTIVLAESFVEFNIGLKAIATLTSGTTFVCLAPDANVEIPDDKRLQGIEFAGPHPAGLPGTHMHSVGLPVHAKPDLWHIGYQDVVAIGKLLLTGRVSTERIISIAGPAVKHATLVRTSLGADTRELVSESDLSGSRLVSGSLLCGTGPAAFLGRYHNQLTLIPEPNLETGGKRSLKLSLRGLLPGAIGDGETSDTAVNGWPSGMLPVENFERVWPFRHSPVPLLRALLSGDTHSAARLGCLGLAEEDLALCTYVCPAKREYAKALRTTLQSIEQFG